MAKRSSSVESFDEYDLVVVDDLSSWEFIDPSSSDDGEDLDNFSLSEENLVDDAISGSGIEGPYEFGSPSSDISMQSLLTELQSPNLDVVSEHHDAVYDDLDDGGDGVVRDNSAVRDHEYDKYDDEYDYDDYYEDYGFDLDDELVPIRVSSKFGRQRIRKLGKRACPRMNKSKRLPYQYNRPGCVHGKHGLGVQHAYI